jgi:hypothetical protein
MDIPNDDWTAYLNRRTGELTSVADDDLRVVEDGGEPEWSDAVRVREILESNDWLPLPSPFDIHEYSIMERFCHEVESDEIRNELLFAIRGKGAFRMFKHQIHQFGIQEQWYRYRQEALEEIAIDWLEEHGIRYSRTPINANGK